LVYLWVGYPAPNDPVIKVGMPSSHRAAAAAAAAAAEEAETKKRSSA